MASCVFCQIVSGEREAEKVYEDKSTLAFYDIKPVAPIHVLVIPKIHLASILEIKDKDLAYELFNALQKTVRVLNLEDRGFRVITNTGKDGNQTVFHLHFHILGGKSLTGF